MSLSSLVLLLFARSFLDSDISKNQIFGTCLLLYSLHSIDSFKIGQFDLLTVESGTSDCLSGVPTSVKSSVFQSIKMGLWDWSIFFFGDHLCASCLPVDEKPNTVKS